MNQKISLPEDQLFILKNAYITFLDTLNMADYFYYLELREVFKQDALNLINSQAKANNEEMAF